MQEFLRFQSEELIKEMTSQQRQEKVIIIKRITRLGLK